jgi:uncharacterized YigZ family protein
MATFSYLTIKAPAKGMHKERGSKFLAFAFPVDTEGEVKAHIKNLRKEYFDARHHGYAYILGPDKKKYRAFDDGEPGHSTGDPILGQLKSRNLTNVLVVVVRYFGGTKLGVGGLITAYKTAADLALNDAMIIEKEVMERIHLRYDYDTTPAVMRLVREFELKMLEQNFSEEGKLVAEIKLKLLDSFLEKVRLLQALGSHMTLLEE